MRLVNGLFDWRRPWALLIVLALHTAFFYALQAGLLRRLAATPVMREVMATLLPPETPVQPPQPRPPAPRVVSRQPLPATRIAPPPPVALPPAILAPSESAITLPVVAPTPAPAPFQPAPPVSAPPAPAPVQVSVPSPLATAAPAPPEPAPVIPPRFDAAYLDNPAPAYPSLARRMGEQGKVLLRVRVNAGGQAEDVQVKTGSGHPRLDDAALSTVKQWRFVPARQGDQPVAAWVLVPIVYRLEGW